MNDPADRLEAETNALSDVRRANLGDYIHEYTGVLAETDERVRILTLPPELADIDAAVDAFAQVSDQWYNASANANIRPIRERDKTPRPWVAVPDDNAETLTTAQPDLSPSAIGTLIAETADALRTLGLYNTVHGYLSPDDIYFPNGTDRTDDLMVEVGGFGLEATIRTAIGEEEPTAYTAPELLSGSKQPSEQTDVYGLGAITYFALTDQPPIAGADLTAAVRDGPTNPPSTYADGIPADVDEVVLQALSPNPADRYESPYAFHRAFLSVFDPDELGPADTSGGGDDEAKTVGSAESTDATSNEDDDASPSEEADESADSEETDETNVTRRVAVGLLGVGAVGVGGWYLSRGQPTTPDRGDRTAADPTDQTATPNPSVEPSASISMKPADPSVGEEVTFSATESTTGEGVSVDTYEWAVGADAEFTVGEETLTQSFSESGEQTIRLRTTDSQDRTATATTTVVVDQPPAPPSASISRTRTNPILNEEVTFSAAESTVGEGVSLTTYEWAVGTDATFSVGEETLTESFSESREHTIRLRITDSRDRTATATTTVSVRPLADGAPMFRYNAANAGTNPTETGPKTSIGEKWAFETGGVVDSSPAVVDGTVYVGSGNDNVYALSAEDGTEQWAFETEGVVDSSPAVVDGTVYVGSTDNSVYALSAEDGTEQWSFQTGDSVFSSPAVVGGTVYVGSNDGHLYALDAVTGQERWDFETGISETRRVVASPAVVDGTVYVGTLANGMHAVDAASGDQEWVVYIRGGVVSSPAVVDGTVYVGSNDGNMHALSADDGTEQWAFETEGAVTSSPAVVDDTVYVGSDDGHLYALDDITTNAEWEFSPEIIADVNSSPAVVDGTVYVGSGSGYVYAVDTVTGNKQWDFDTGGWVRSSPAVVDGIVYIGSRDGNVYALSE